MTSAFQLGRYILVFSLFNIVQFNNGGCRSSSTISGGGTGSTNRNGTCFTMNECVSKGGSAAGSCAAGFGVCCVFLVSTSGATVTQNCTYVRNPNFPNSLDTTSQISYNIQKCDRSSPNGCGCLQYHTGLTGRFTTFNFLPTNDNHLANQDYSVCIRQEAGFCCIEYSVCSDANSFSIDTNKMLMMSKVETECLTIDYITIEGGQGSCAGSNNPTAGVNKYCGDKLNPLTMQIEHAPVCGKQY
ncbi:hypothetical protein TCAL_13448 [Tigriopus californicus]|uniref:CUB domain-containing protein n=1 Tax=Tigriopus californicus TaxID=6832 RepID=A0A553PTP2_TIGCA|nr:hypothetical protein TCAL_13448 [Tigriopus californicus]|eukprot:TCALIF_13448-PA protein Name:"Protein of unknown function" AED:0.37 eAED:0.37 QI:0/0.4/0.16/0.5/0.6/0.83/6/0/242